MLTKQCPLIKNNKGFLIKLRWRGKLLQLTCLPNGLSLPYACLQKSKNLFMPLLERKGILNAGYIDE